MVVSIQDVIIRRIGPFIIGKAVMASFLKSMFIQDTFIRDRTRFDRYKSSYIGDLAKLAVKEWLEEQGFDVVDYDDVRTDNWRSQRKPYDLQVNNHNIEVRSSIASRPSLQWVINNEHIIHPCNVRVKEITIQAFFRDRSCSEVWLCAWTLRKYLENDRYKTIRYVGGRPVDFYMMPFNDAHAFPMRQLISYLQRR